ncbi:hypothetical protein ACFYV5_30800 [Streptomyces sp. NPDC003035]|uniref:hypothetical protein n=1 Tax=unclassified Streptomyces TaxID=2593676 RepID=UPI0033B5CA62
MSDRPTHQDPAAQPARALGESVFRESEADASPGQGYPVRCMTAGDYWYDRGPNGAGSTAPFGPYAPQGSE